MSRLPAPTDLEAVRRRIVACDLCPRLRAHCLRVARDKKREFRDWEYWGRPVPGFGDPAARVLVVGLAPAAHGGNRTGRVFTGDSSGDWLYEALHRYGFANQATSRSADDGLVLNDVYVAAAARCAPPDNKPTREEMARCAPYLREEFRLLADVRVVIALGRVAFDACLTAGAALAPAEVLRRRRRKPRFAHDTVSVLPGGRLLIASFHPSRRNTNTGLLTRRMWHAVFRRARRLADGDGTTIRTGARSPRSID